MIQTLLNPDFVEFAKSFGAYAKRVEDLGDFKETLRDALAAEQPALIEVMLQERQDDIINVIGWLMSEPLRKTGFLTFPSNFTTPIYAIALAPINSNSHFPFLLIQKSWNPPILMISAWVGVSSDSLVSS